MKTIQHLAPCALILILASCAGLAPKGNTDMAATTLTEPAGTVLFDDPMTENWEKNWFLDGKKATLEHRDGGLFYAAGDYVSKRPDRTEFDTRHAVLWTKKVFEGDVRITFTMTKLETHGSNLIYIQAQGIGTPSFPEDIHAWRKFRGVARMDKYFKYMNLISLSLRGEVRCKRYPTVNAQDETSKFKTVLVEPMVNYDQMPHGKSYNVEVVKRKGSLSLTICQIGSDTPTLKHTWDIVKGLEDRTPRYVVKGRIGLRQMTGNKVIYKNFKVKQL